VMTGCPPDCLLRARAGKRVAPHGNRWLEIAGTQDMAITINNIGITMMTIFSQECAGAHLIKLK
jgi:hypothetical protein